MANVKKAFQEIDRRQFMPDDAKHLADLDTALPIGFGQTISQPYTVRAMLEWLEVEPGNKILDVGSGSGWTTALLAYLTGPKGTIHAVELIPELLEFGLQNVGSLGLKNIHFHQAGLKLGWPEGKPYDRILVSAAAEKVPQALIDQLKVGGKMVIPVENDILEIEKIAKDKLDIQAHEGFVFVPLL